MRRRFDVLAFRVGLSLLIKGILIAALLIVLYSGLAPEEGRKVWLAVLTGLGAGTFLLDFLFLVRPYRQICAQELRFLQRPRWDARPKQPIALTRNSRALETAYDEWVASEVRADEARRRAGYLALQNQINPHFLYNTLDAIRSDAMKVKAWHIADLIEALSSFFAYTISNMDQYATLYEELAHVKEYYYIQKYRFQDRLNLEIDNAEEVDLQGYYVPRLLLQPLVENAISHGLELRKTRGTVRISFSETAGDLIIRVSDDGAGIEEETLRQLNQRLENPAVYQDTERRKRGGVALDNVNSRIRMLAGDEYGLHIYSVRGVGTDVVIRLPKISEVE